MMSLMWNLKYDTGNSLAVQRLGCRASTAGGMGSIPGQGTNTPHAVWRGQKKKNPTQMNLSMKQRLTDIENRLVVAKDGLGVWD